MSKSNDFEHGWLVFLFQNDDTDAVIADISTGLQASAADGDLYVSLHVADQGEAGSQITSEADYVGYLRVAVARTAAGWTVAGNSVSNAAEIAFPICGGGANVITHFGVGTNAAGAGYLLYSGALTSSLTVNNGITPKFAIGDLDISED